MCRGNLLSYCDYTGKGVQLYFSFSTFPFSIILMFSNYSAEITCIFEVIQSLFLLNTGLIIQRWFAIAESRPFLLFVLLCWWEGWGSMGGWEETQPETKKFFRLYNSHCIKRGKRKNWKHFECWCLSSQVTVTPHKTVPSWRRLNTFLPLGSSDLIHCFTLLGCMASDFSFKISLSQLMGFLAITLLILCPVPLVRSEKVAVGYLVAGWD